LANSPAVLTPNLSPAYNNEAFALLGLIFYRATGKTYGELIHSEIVEPLNMTNTGVSPGNTSRGVIPTDNSFWGADFGLNAPQGGLYSSTNDLCKFASAILNHTILPSDSATRAWLKPTGMLPQVRGLVGRPWEIYRTSGLTKRYPHTVDVYAKNGGIPGYLSRFALVDEYGIGIVALTVGPKAVLDSVTKTAMSLLVEAADNEARKQAQVYVGNYSTTTADVGHVEVQMGIDIDDGPGLRVMNLTRNGSDILEAIRILFISNSVVASDLSPTEWRIYPTEIQRMAHVDEYGGDVVLEDWRLGIEPIVFDVKSGLPSEGIFRDALASWPMLDSVYYGGRSVDRVVVVKGKDVVGVEVPALRANLTRLAS
jgi:hypothetical protein